VQNLAPTKEDRVSSNPASSQVDPAGSSLVREVSGSAGRWGSQSDASSELKRDVSAHFPRDMGTKSVLLNSLANRERSAKGASLDQRPRYRAIDRWHDEVVC
jgi:hypothetical protein